MKSEIKVEFRTWGLEGTPRLFTNVRVVDYGAAVHIWATNADRNHVRCETRHLLAAIRWSDTEPGLRARRRAARQVFDLLLTRYNIQGDLTWAPTK